MRESVRAVSPPGLVVATGDGAAGGGVERLPKINAIAARAARLRGIAKKMIFEDCFREVIFLRHAAMSCSRWAGVRLSVDFVTEQRVPMKLVIS